MEARERSEDKLPPVVVFSHDPDGAVSALRAAKAKPSRNARGTVTADTVIILRVEGDVFAVGLWNFATLGRKRDV